jgi:pseudaminic acid biosynthesis-associated methylase
MNETTDQLGTWQGEFGKAYTERNIVDWHVRIPAFAHMLKGLELKRILEVGCNRGHNLRCVSEVLGDSAEVFGVEPNRYALELAQETGDRTFPIPGNAFDLPFKDGYCDLVFTVGVLIHISPDNLLTALREIERVSSRYILAAEYFSEEDEVVEYRNKSDLLWKRNFLKHYQAEFPRLRILNGGYWGAAEGFDRTNWWLLEKSGD